MYGESFSAFGTGEPPYIYGACPISSTVPFRIDDGGNRMDRMDGDNNGEKKKGRKKKRWEGKSNLEIIGFCF